MTMKLTSIEADRWKMDGGVAFGVVPKSLWSKAYPADEFNLIDITTRCLLIQHDSGNILIDTGMGNKRGEKYYKFKYRTGEEGLLPGLAKAGLSPADITDIVFTHLHDDHVGGATQLRQDGSIEEVFPNARYWCSEAQWKWAWNSNKREQAAFFPDNLQKLEQSGRLNLVTTPGPWIPGISFRIFNGHTRGQIVPFIGYNKRTLVFCADFIPSKGHIPLAWVPSVDIEPLLTLSEKESFLTEAAHNQYMLLFQHDFYHEACALVSGEKGPEAGDDILICNL